MDVLAMFGIGPAELLVFSVLALTALAVIGLLVAAASKFLFGKQRD